MTRSTPPSALMTALARDRLGMSSVVFFVMSGVAPLTVAAGVITTAYAVTGLTGIPIAFVAVGMVLGLFSVGYLAMSRHITNAGAFYAFIARGLSRPAGVGAALVALVAYNMLQVGLYGAFGPGLRDYMDSKFHVHAAWWVWALGAWLVVTILGLLRVDLNGKVLAVLVSLEILVVVALTIAGLLHPAHWLSFATLSPHKLFASGIGAALVIAVLGFVGFEGAVVFSEETRHPRRTVPTATYLSLGCIALVYAAAAWSMSVHYGVDQVVGSARQMGPGLMFSLGNRLLNNLGQTFYLTSLFAAMLAFHSFVTRYMFALGREGVLPRSLAHTGASGSPKVASATQSTIGFVVIVLYAVMGWDPLVKLFFWLGTSGGFGILLLVAATSLAVIGFFARQPSGESAWHRILAPGTACVVLVVMVYLALRNYATLLGVAPGHPATRWLPLTFLFAAVAGLIWALSLRGLKPEVYAGIGLGADAVTGRDTPPDTGTPQWQGARP